MGGTMETVPVMLAEYEKRRKRIVEGLCAIPGITCEWPGGAVYAFPDASAHLGEGRHAQARNCSELSEVLLEKAHVAVVPGGAFGASGYLRLSCATSVGRIEEVVRRVERLLCRV